jgi:signal peptidase I
MDNKEKEKEPSAELSTMDKLYREVEDYNSPESQKKRKHKKVWSAVGDAFFAFVIGVFGYFIILVNVAKENNKVPFIFGYSIEYVETGSMIPTLPIGSVIVSKQVDQQTAIKVGYKDSDEPGDIITFYNADDVIVTHRAVETYTEGSIQYYLTKGDNNSSLDPKPIPRSSVISVFIRRVI